MVDGSPYTITLREVIRYTESTDLGVNRTGKPPMIPA